MNNFDDIRKTEEFLDNYERWRKLAIRQMKRDLVSIVSGIGMCIGMLSVFILTIISMFSSTINLMNFMTMVTEKTDIYSILKQFKLFTLDNNYLTWFIPMSLWGLSYLGYRKTKPRNEPDIMKESLRLTAIRMGFIKNKSNSLPTKGESSK